jgi:hypothetical protein
MFRLLVCGAALANVACGDDGTSPSTSTSETPGQAQQVSNDESILDEYLAEHPELIQGHQHWHAENYQAAEDYGDLFLGFHHRLVEKFDAWRRQRGYDPLTPWDPATQIPDDAPHAGRESEDPSSVDPRCRRPSWLTLAGGQARDPDFGAGKLDEFVSTNQLGRSIDSLTPPYWHTRVHATIGGDIGSSHRVVFDPIFWRFHKFIDQIWGEWQTATGRVDPQYAPSSSP